MFLPDYLVHRVLVPGPYKDCLESLVHWEQLPTPVLAVDLVIVVSVAVVHRHLKRTLLQLRKVSLSRSKMLDCVELHWNPQAGDFLKSTQNFIRRDFIPCDNVKFCTRIDQMSGYEVFADPVCCIRYRLDRWQR